jgi:hypothetical protein
LISGGATRYFVCFSSTEFFFKTYDRETSLGAVETGCVSINGYIRKKGNQSNISSKRRKKTLRGHTLEALFELFWELHCKHFIWRGKDYSGGIHFLKILWQKKNIFFLFGFYLFLFLFYLKNSSLNTILP